MIDLFIELNGQLRLVQIKQSGSEEQVKHPQADPNNSAHVGASMPGMISSIAVKSGQRVMKGETLFTIEAMKMELAVKADRDCKVEEIYLSAGKQVRNMDLILVLS